MTNLIVRLSKLAKNGIFQDRDHAPDFSLEQKKFHSLINKIYRLNCIWNRKWPLPPKGGWVTYQESFNRIDDLIRTTIITKYLDGPQIIATEIVAAAQESGLNATAVARATDTGYYAWHAYVVMPAQVIIHDNLVDVLLNIEFQTTTLLQSVLRELTHRFYEESRAAPSGDKTGLRWDYASDRFRGEYLGHTLHLVDAMIVELRDAQVTSTLSAEPAAPAVAKTLEEKA